MVHTIYFISLVSFCFALSDLPRLPATREKASVSVGGAEKSGVPAGTGKAIAKR